MPEKPPLKRRCAERGKAAAADAISPEPAMGTDLGGEILANLRGRWEQASLSYRRVEGEVETVLQRAQRLHTVAQAQGMDAAQQASHLLHEVRNLLMHDIPNLLAMGSNTIDRFRALAEAQIAHALSVPATLQEQEEAWLYTLRQKHFPIDEVLERQALPWLHENVLQKAREFDRDNATVWRSRQGDDTTLTLVVAGIAPLYPEVSFDQSQIKKDLTWGDVLSTRSLQLLAGLRRNRPKKVSYLMLRPICRDIYKEVDAYCTLNFPDNYPGLPAAPTIVVNAWTNKVFDMIAPPCIDFVTELSGLSLQTRRAKDRVANISLEDDFVVPQVSDAWRRQLPSKYVRLPSGVRLMCRPNAPTRAMGSLHESPTSPLMAAGFASAGWAATHTPHPQAGAGRRTGHGARAHGNRTD